MNPDKLVIITYVGASSCETCGSKNALTYSHRPKNVPVTEAKIACPKCLLDMARKGACLIKAK
jgi:hypothetical protein